MNNTTTETKMYLASFDIGSKNFCFYIEEVDIEQLRTIKNIDKNLRYNANFTPTEEMKSILSEVYSNGKCVIHINENITSSTPSSKYLDKSIYYNMIDHLDKYKEILKLCSYFVIEQQLKKNTKAMKIAQHCYSYLAITHSRDKIIVEFPAYYKGTVLGAEKTVEKKYKNGNLKWKSLGNRERKQWSISTALDMLTKRGEIDVINNIKTKAKKDDLADTFCQLQAFKYLHFVDNMQF